MLAEGLLFLGGLAALVVGADRAVTTAGDLALYYGVSPFFIGVTLVSVGTSVPEMVMSVYAAYYAAGDLVVGNIVGSETARMTLAIAIVAFIAPFVSDRRSTFLGWTASRRCMAPVRRLVIDVLKPHDPPLVEFTDGIAGIDSVDGATCSLIELDKEVQNVKVTVEGEDVDLAAIEERIETLGGTIHSVDQVACGEYIVTDRRTLQDA